jgi:selenocysteine lyase/cysteine desulfurase
MGLLQLAVGIPSGTVLVASGEFPANRYPWLRAAQLGRITPRFIGAPGEAMTPELVAPQLTPDVVAVSVSAVDFRTGFRADLAGLREAIGDRLLIVDGIQGFGVIDTDWTVVDALVAGGQKWLRSGWGTGFLALSARALDRIEPVLSGWTGVADAYLFDGQLHEQAAGAAAFSVTNLSPIAFGGFAAGLELIEQVGVAAIADRIAELHDGFLERLAGTGVVALSSPDAARRAGIAPVSVPGADLAAAHAALTAEGISTTLHGPDRIRVSMHASTDPAALDRAAELLQSFA